MKYFDDIFDLDEIISKIANDVEIAESQMNIIYDRLVVDSEVSKEDVMKRFFEIQMPFRIAYDYFYSISKMIEKMRVCYEQTFNDAVNASKKLEVSDMLEELSTFDSDSLQEVMRFARAYTKH